MNIVEELKEIVQKGGKISAEQAILLYDQPLELICSAADRIREQFCGKGFDICSIVNGKSGKCSEDCKYCAQSSFYHTKTDEYELLGTEEILRQARYNKRRGVLRYSIVTSGRCLNEREVERMCETVRKIKTEVKIEVCASFGLLRKDQFRKLKEAGVSRVHNNLETSRRNFHNVCTTHTFDDKISAVKDAMAAGLEVCSGGIVGLGETKEDQVDMAVTLRELGVRSIPINMLNPISGTPYAENPMLTMDDMKRIVAVYRFILPQASIRLAGGRGLMEDKGEGCFRSGANAAISGDMLTTSGYTIETDMDMIHRLGFQPKQSV